MNNMYFWLVVSELIILAIIVVIKLVFNYFEKQKINGILEFMKKRAKEKDMEEKFKQCLEIIEHNRSRN